MRRKEHICVTCGKQDAYTLAGRHICYECCQRQRVYMRKHRSKEGVMEAQSLKQREQYAQLIAAGICTACKRRKAEPGHTRCIWCKYKHNLANRKLRPLIDSTLCTHCHKEEPLPGHKLCKRCYETTLAAQAKATAASARNNTNHIWRICNRAEIKQREI